MKDTTDKLMAYLCATIMQIAPEEYMVSELQIEMLFAAIEEYNKSIKEEEK